MVVKRCMRISSRAESVFSGKMLITCSCSQELKSEVGTDNLAQGVDFGLKGFSLIGYY